MAEPVKIKFEYQNPENVEAEVPESQTIREPGNGTETEENNDNEGNIKENGEETKESMKNGVTITREEYTETNVSEESSCVQTRHKHVFNGKRIGIHGEPVMFAVTDKLDDKKSKIPISRFRQSVEKVKAERRSVSEKEKESHIPVRRSSISKPLKDSKIPPSSVKYEASVTKNVNISDSTETVLTRTVSRTDDKVPEIKIEKEIKTINADDEFDKLFADVVNDLNTDINIDDSILGPKVEDPEKLESKFEEIIHDYEEHKVEPIDVEVIRRSKLPLLKRRSQQDYELGAQTERASKIIAARDKVRLRHSMNKDENLEKALDEELQKAKNSTSEDKNNPPKVEPPNVDKTSEIKHEIISSPDSKVETITHTSKTVSKSSSNEIDNSDAFYVVFTTNINETSLNETIDKTENSKSNANEEKIVQQSNTSVVQTKVHEYSESIQSIKTTQAKQTMSYKSTQNDELSTINKDNESVSTVASNGTSTFEKQKKVSDIINDIKTKIEVSAENTHSVSNRNEIKTKHFKSINVNKLHSETLLEEKPQMQDLANKETDTNLVNNVEDVQYRNKVDKLIHKLDSKEVIETEGNERESINELRKKKSVLSKIALFERKPSDSSPIKPPIKETKSPKLITKDWQKIEKVHVHTPLIVDELFKPSFAVVSNQVLNKEETHVIDKTDETEKIDQVKVDHSDTQSKLQILHSTKEEKSSDIVLHQITPVEDSKTSKPKLGQAKDDLHPNDLVTPSVKSDKFEFKYNKTRLSVTKEIQAPVIIPGFKPVSDLLKNFEFKNEINKTPIQRSSSKNIVLRRLSSASHSSEHRLVTAQISKIESYATEITYDDLNSTNDFKSLDDVFTNETEYQKPKSKYEDDAKRPKSLADIDLSDAVKGKVSHIKEIIRSVNKAEVERRETIDKKELPRKRSVSEKIALFEGKLTPSRSESPVPLRIFKTENITQKLENATTLKTNETEPNIQKEEIYRQEKKIELVRVKNVLETAEKTTTEASKRDEEEIIRVKIEELENAKLKYGSVENMTRMELSNGVMMPVMALGTALLDPRLTYHIVSAAIELGYRAIDSAFIYGNERLVGEAIRDKIADGTVKREDLFIINKLWSTFHRTDLVEDACRASLETMGLDYFDLYLVHNPMSFKEGAGPFPKIATVIQYSEYDYLDAWYGMEKLLPLGLAKSIGVSNFNSLQLQRVLDKGKVKPVINQVECHPYLSQQRLDLYCAERNVTLSCFGVLGSKGTPAEYRNDHPAAIDDPLVKVMASGLGITPAQLLISYQLESGHGVVVKSSSGRHLHDNLGALAVHLTTAQVDALHALNRNKRMFTFKGMGDTHKNYPFHAAY